MDTATLMKPQPEGLVGKVVNLLCHCSPESLCRECCECCLEKREPETREITHIKISPHGTRRITKEDIQPVIISQQPQSQNSISQMRTRLNSTNSETESETEKSEHSGAGVSRGGSFYSAQNSPVNRERLDSTDKWSTPSRNSSRTGSRHGSTSSRKGSTSSGDYPLSKRGGGCANNPTPVIDMKPIEFWAATNKETVQPRTPKKRLLSESEISVDDFKPHLYEAVDGESNQCLTDEQKLARFRLGELHISLHYDMGAKCLLVRVIEAKDLPKPYCHDSSRQDMAHSNPYCKVCLLPDRKTLQQTTVQRKTQSPQWDETFTFEVPFKEVQTRKIELVVKDFDKFSRHCVVGEVTLRLDDDNLNLVKGCHMWKPIMPCEKEPLPTEMIDIT